jgi:hypothetical protein
VESRLELVSYASDGVEYTVPGVKVKVTVCLGVKPNLGLLTRDLFFFPWFKVTALSLWGALSDERLGLSFVRWLLFIHCQFDGRGPMLRAD